MIEGVMEKNGAGGLSGERGGRAGPRTGERGDN